MSFWYCAFAVFRKEWMDALRDRRTLLVVLASSVLLGPLLLLALSTLVADLEARSEQREVVVAGIEHAPGLKNYLERQTWQVKAAPADYETLLRGARLGEPVLVVPAGFEAALFSGEVPELLLVSDSANAQSQSGVPRVVGLLRGYMQERVSLSLALRGVSPELLAPLTVQERDLAGTQTRAAQFTSMLAFFLCCWPWSRARSMRRWTAPPASASGARWSPC